MAGARSWGGRRHKEDEIISASFGSSKECDPKGGNVVVDRRKVMEVFVAIGDAGDLQDIELLINEVGQNGDNQVDSPNMFSSRAPNNVGSS